MTAAEIRGAVVIPGEASGHLCRLSKPISFWGGVDPETGRIIDPRHPDYGRDISKTILALPAAIGSSSSSAVMLELLRHDTAPAGLLIGGTDTILTLGVIVARELGYSSIPVVRVGVDEFAALPSEGRIRITQEGVVAAVE